tara:strand:+ start:92 stop:325 length:234 start_codon:yes stop_codon:yes gene_type:complete
MNKKNKARLGPGFHRFPFNHVVLEDRKEVWIKGGYPGCMGVPKLMERFYPGYTAKLARNEFIEKLKKDYTLRDTLDA